VLAIEFPSNGFVYFGIDFGQGSGHSFLFFHAFAT
jgi:hypothetical protein